MAAMKQKVKNVKGSEYFPYPLYKGNICSLKLKTSKSICMHHLKYHNMPQFQIH